MEYSDCEERFLKIKENQRIKINQINLLNMNFLFN